jgi:hypothetical protein
MQCLIVGGKPMEEKNENRMALFNEIMVSFFLYVSFSLTDFNKNPLFTEGGTALMCVVICAASVNFLKFIISFIKITALYCKRWWYKKPQAQEDTNKEPNDE